MIKRTIKYKDFNGEERTEDFYFNLSMPEITEWELGRDGGLSTFIEKVVAEKDQKNLIGLFKELILLAYGEKSPDGKRFVKSKEISEAFTQTNAYSELFMDMIQDEEFAVTFVNGLVPKELHDRMNKLPNTSN